MNDESRNHKISKVKNPSPLAKIQTVLFDFDGTLVNTTPLILHCFRATWEKLFGFTLPETHYIHTFGIPIDTAMQQLLNTMMNELRVAPVADIQQAAEEMVSTYREFNLALHDQMIEPFAEVDEMLLKLKAGGKQLGLVTSKKRVGAERGMRIFEMQNFFDVIICAEDVSQHKPHPEPLLHAMEKLSAHPASTIYAGDSTHDIIAGRAAGLITVAAAWGPFTRAALQAARPDYILETPLKLSRLLGH